MKQSFYSDTILGKELFRSKFLVVPIKLDLHVKFQAWCHKEKASEFIPWSVSDSNTHGGNQHGGGNQDNYRGRGGRGGRGFGGRGRGRGNYRGGRQVWGRNFELVCSIWL